MYSYILYINRERERERERESQREREGKRGKEKDYYERNFASGSVRRKDDN